MDAIDLVGMEILSLSLAIVLIALVNSVRLLSIVYWFADSVNR